MMVSTPALRTIRILISSPGDVAEERDRARQVIDGLRRRYSRKFLLKPVLWEELALQVDVSFQQGIDLVLSRDQGIDIAVFILWSRLGSAVGPTIKRSGGGEYRSGTERELDLMLAARRRGDGSRPAILAYTRSDETCFEERLRGRPTAEKAELIAQKKLVEAFIAENFSNQESGHNTRAYHSFDRPTTFSQRLRTHLIELLDQMAGETTETIWDIDRQGPPYLGLKAFQPEHAEIFFGREEESLEVRFELRERAKQGCAFLLLTGASGSGKSSLARSGVLPDIVQHDVDDQVVAWRSIAFTPAELTQDPILGLMQRLATPQVWSDLRNDPASLQKLAQGFKKNPQLAFDLGLQPAIDRLGARYKGRVRLLLVIDQMEEVFASHVMTPADRAAFLHVIEVLAQSGSIWVLATARSDFFHQIQSEPLLVRLLEGRGPMPVLPPGADALQRLIEEPARLAGLKFEERGGVSLSRRILRDAIAHAELLPLLEFVLRELYERSRATGGLLSWSAYDELGGIEGAVGKRAEDTFQELSPESQAALAEILPLLVTVETAGEQSAVRRYAPLNELQATPERRALTDSLIANRFLTTDRQNETSVASFSHEALLRRWDRISNWINSNREHLRIRSRILGAVANWEKHNRSGDLLLSAGKPLDEANELAASNLVLEPAVREYIEHSRSRALRNLRLRRAAISLLVLLTVVSAISGAYAWRAQGLAEESQQLAENRAQALTEQLYDSAIVIAEREINENHDIGKACALLEGPSCPESLRGWEWHYLMRLRDGKRLALKDRETDLGGTHDIGLWGAEFSPDGALIATCSIDGTVKIWDSHTNELIRPIEADRIANMGEFLRMLGVEKLPIMCVSFSPDGKKLATGSLKPNLEFGANTNQQLRGLIRIWDVATGRLESEFTEQKGVCLALAFSPDGQRIASSSMNADNSFVVWDVQSKQIVKRVLGHKSHILRLRFSPDGKSIASGDTDGMLKLRSTSDFKELFSIKAHAAPLIGISFAPGERNRIATAGEDGFVRIWQTDDGSAVRELTGHAGAALDVRYSPDGTRLASAGFDKTIRIWDAETGNAKLTLRGHTDLVWTVAFSPDDGGRRLVSASFDKTARIWDATPRVEPPGEGEFALSGHTERVNSVAANENSEQFVTAGWDKTIRLWDAQTGKPGQVLEGHDGPIWCVTLSPDGHKIASASWDNTVRLWDRKTGRLLFTLKDHGAPVQSVGFSPDGRRLASGGFDGTVKIWDVATGRLITTAGRFFFPVFSVVFSPDGKRIASGGTDRRITIWDAASGVPVDQFPEDDKTAAHEASIFSLAYSPDGRRLASASWDHTVCVWDAAAKAEGRSGGKPLLLKGHKDRVNAVVFSPRGTRLATASEDKTVRFWDVTTGEEAAPPRIHRDIVWSVAFAGDGRRLISASWENPVWIHAWNLAGSKPFEEER